MRRSTSLRLLNDHGGTLTSAWPRPGTRRSASGCATSGSCTSTPALARAVQTGELAAAVLGVEVTVREGLHEFGVGDARGQTIG